MKRELSLVASSGVGIIFQEISLNASISIEMTNQVETPIPVIDCLKPMKLNFDIVHLICNSDI
ncbi:CLUMA_CG019920, isoform A [Clunio marinus]|uniref:CLUMA_CG019920, isoform A n=1 Tax=Clunio marinus TaxID=568069 RepID=A0A1J1J306_9DIPT|nr:CLUMA_CG019920, isoform A [Clunio marinus]